MKINNNMKIINIILNDVLLDTTKTTINYKCELSNGLQDTLVQDDSGRLLTTKQAVQYKYISINLSTQPDYFISVYRQIKIDSTNHIVISYLIDDKIYSDKMTNVFIKEINSPYSSQPNEYSFKFLATDILIAEENTK